MFNICKYVILYNLFATLVKSQLYNTSKDKRRYIPLNRYNFLESWTGDMNSESQNNLNESRNEILHRLLDLITSNEIKHNVEDANDNKTKLNRMNCRDLRGDKIANLNAKIRYYTTSHIYPYWKYIEFFKHYYPNNPSEYYNKADHFGFSNDYLDVNDLGRSDVDRPERFSRDYLDVGDLVRRDEGKTSKSQSIEVIHKYLAIPKDVLSLFKMRKTTHPLRGKYLNEVGKKTSADISESEPSEESNSVEKNRFKIVKTPPSGSSSTSLEVPAPKKVSKESESNSNEKFGISSSKWNKKKTKRESISNEDTNEKIPKWKKKNLVDSESISNEEVKQMPEWKKNKIEDSESISNEVPIKQMPKRKEKKHGSDSISISDEGLSDQTPEKEKSSEHDSEEKPIIKERFVYMQGRNRILGDRDFGGRKRLEHFLPKRFHWNEDEFKTLGYFWFNANRGKFADPWRSGTL